MHDSGGHWSQSPAWWHSHSPWVGLGTRCGSLSPASSRMKGVRCFHRRSVLLDHKLQTLCIHASRAEAAWLSSKINVKNSNVCFIQLNSSGTQSVLTVLSPSPIYDTEHVLTLLWSYLPVIQNKCDIWSVLKYVWEGMTGVKLRRGEKKSWQQLFTVFNCKRTTGHPLEWTDK